MPRLRIRSSVGFFRFRLFLCATACAGAMLASATSARSESPIARETVSTQGDSTAIFAVSATVAPTSAPIGAPFDFHFTVTNVSSETAGFTIGGCPVQVLVDGEFSPLHPCAEFAREIRLEPGQSITFGPDQDPSLHFDPHDFPLGPGAHHAVLWMPGIGEAVVEMHVQEPDPARAYGAGQVVLENWLRVLGTATLLLMSDPATGVLDGIQTPLGPQGHFLFDKVPPGTYLLRVDLHDATWWYPGTQDPTLAAPIELPAGVYVDGLKLLLPPGPPPPWPGLFELSGTVYEDCPECASPVPPTLAGALVLAVPVNGSPPDSSDSTGVVPGGPPGVESSAGMRSSDYPEPIGRFFAATDEQGRFTLLLPEGAYRILAGRPGTHRYQYWNHVFEFDLAGLYPVPSRVAEPEFELPKGENLPAVLAGAVYGHNPLTDGLPHPIEGAQILAIPVLVSPLADYRAFTATTGPDGSYHLEVPSDSPYRVVASAPGFESRFYQDAVYQEDARWVDVAGGATTEHIDFLLPTALPGFGKGAIEGTVYRIYPGAACPSPAGLSDCAVPVAGALVRVVPAYPTLGSPRNFAPEEFRTFTGPDGRFRVDGLLAEPDGSLAYFVSAQIENSEPAYYPGGVPFPEAVPLAVFPENVSDTGPLVINAPQPPQEGVVFGRVTNPDGAPIEHALVRVYVDPTNPRGRIARALTGPTGEFHVGDLPAGIGVLVSAEAQGFVPAYHPGVQRWRQAERVFTGGPNVRLAPLHLVLSGAVETGPFIQAGLIVVAPDGSGSDSGWVEPEPLGAGFASYSSRLEALSHGIGPLTYDLGIRDAFFYMVNALTMGPTERAVAGGSSGDNGAVILTGLPEGIYIAFADRPGFESAYFPADTDAPQLITLNGTTPAVLARIELTPLFGEEKDPAAAPGRLVHLTNVPNPFRPQTVIHYTLREPRSVTIQIFDASGRLMRTLARDEIQGAGDWERPWDGHDEAGRLASPGVYFTRIQAGPDQLARKMVLLP